MTLLAAVGDTPYRILLILHLLTAMAAFAPAFTHPFLTKQSKALGPEGHQSVIGYLATNGQRIYAMALIGTGVFGFALQGLSDGAFEFGQAWFIVAIIVWVAMNGVLHAMILPNERRMANGESEAQSAVDMGGAIITVLLIVMLYLMVFKPGL